MGVPKDVKRKINVCGRRQMAVRMKTRFWVSVRKDGTVADICKAVELEAPDGEEVKKIGKIVTMAFEVNSKKLHPDDKIEKIRHGLELVPIFEGDF